MNQKQAWVFYDFGNSAFATTVIAGFFPVFFKQFWSEGVSSEITTLRLGIALGFAGFLMAALAPFWGRKSDESSNRKSWLMSFALLGIFATAALSLIPQGQWALAIAIYVSAYVGFEASLIFYDSLLPLVAKPSEFNRVSSQGYAFGYLGGGLLFILNVVMTLKPELFGLKDVTQAIQFSFLSVALWWAMGLTVLTLKVKENPNLVVAPVKKSAGFVATYKEILSTFKKLMKQKNIFYFLLAYWFFIDGVYTVFTMAVNYGLSIGLNQEDLMKALILTQLVGFPSALFFGFLSQKFSSRSLLLFCLAVYSGVLLYSVQIKTGTDFMILASFVGLVQGGIQALSRSNFTHLIPSGHSAEYFGFFNIVGRSASVVGPLLVAFVTYMTKDARLGLLSIVLLFILGAFFLLKTRSSDQSVSY
jgi:UMF1 family MFS transporter